MKGKRVAAMQGVSRYLKVMILVGAGYITTWFGFESKYPVAHRTRSCEIQPDMKHCSTRWEADFKTKQNHGRMHIVLVVLNLWPSDCSCSGM